MKRWLKILFGFVLMLLLSMALICPQATCAYGPFYYDQPYFPPILPKPFIPQRNGPHSFAASRGSYKDLISVYEAKNLEFWFPSEYEREMALQTGNYNPDITSPLDVEVHYPAKQSEPRIFMTIPSFSGGVPYSLALVTSVQRPNGTELQPYPSYDWHSSHGKNCDGLTSVYRVYKDACNRLWVLDSGEINYNQFCAPQLVVFDLATNKLVHRYRLPTSVFKATVSRFVTPIVDVLDPPPKGRCRQAFVYMADATGTSFVVYDMQKSNSWRIQNKFTFPDPDFGTHTIAGESFELMDGTFSLSVTPAGLGLPRMLFLHSLSNDRQVAVPLDVVNNSTLWNNDTSPALNKFIEVGRRGVQCAAEAMTSQGYLLCGFLDPIAIFGWNIRLPYNKNNFISLAENPDTLQFVSGLKVVRTPQNKEEVWILSNRLQKRFAATRNYKEINYRILRCGLNELLQHKPCRL